MNPWFESAGVVGLALIGAALGLACHKLKPPWWLAGYFIPLLFILVIGLPRYVLKLELIPPFSILVAGRMEFAMASLLGPMILFTLLPRLPKRRDRFALILFVVLMVCLVVLPVFLAPAFNRSYLKSLVTHFDADGVCRQSNDYLCGPAAAVTALRMLGVEAEEGEIALLAHTTRFSGTETDILAEVLQRRYASLGLKATYRHFHSIDDMVGAFITIARMKYGVLVDHYVTVVKITADEVRVADPWTGLQTWKRETFTEDWRYTGVVLERK